MRDIVSDAAADTAATKCCRFTYDSLDIIAARAVRRGETPFVPAEVIDRVFAPIVYHILFVDRDVGPAYCRTLLANLPPPSRAAA